MNALLTGSRVYGTPKPNSDIDLVVLMSVKDLHRLQELFKDEWRSNTADTGNYDGIGAMSDQFRFGNLNLIVTTDPLAYEVWRRGTEALSWAAPVTRDFAVKFFKKLREHCGVYNAEPSVEDVRKQTEFYGGST